MFPSDIVGSSNLESDLEPGGAHLTNFFAAMQSFPGYTVEDYLAKTPVETCAELVGLIAIEMRSSFAQGKPSHVEEYAARFPQVISDQVLFLDLIYAEYCARKADPETTVEQSEYYDRFPDLKDDLEKQFAVHEFELPGPPQVGESSMGFDLLRKLGHGSFGSVFLAKQTALGNRTVVVKITAMMSDEHEVLGTLNHPSIVPILSVHQEEFLDQQVVCLPYQHAIALNTLQSYWKENNKYPQSLRDITNDICTILGEDAPAEPSEPDPSIPLDYDYNRSCIWIMWQIADALSHAHGKGVYHCDIKPSNILITATGRPLLVDFNLAFQTRDENEVEWKAGGTLPYMPPEQVKAVIDDERSKLRATAQYDIYSLAVTMYELLTGDYLFAQEDDNQANRKIQLTAQLERRLRPLTPPSALAPGIAKDFERITLTCLEINPSDRYTSATHLADDLDNSLHSRPLQYTGPNPLAERIKKFARRNRRRFIRSFAASLIGLAVITAVVTLIQKQMAKNEIEHELATIERKFEPIYFRGWEHFQFGNYSTAIRFFDLALEYASEASQERHAKTYLFRGKSKALSDRDAEAILDYDQSIAISPLPDAHKERGIFYATSEEFRDLARAEQDLKNAVDLLPRDSFSLSLDVAIGFWYVGMQREGGDRELMFDECAKTLQKAKDHAGATRENLKVVMNFDEFSADDFLNSEPVRRVFPSSAD